MENRRAFFDDFSKFASGATGAVMDLRRELESLVRTQMEGFLGKMNLVRREEFEAVKLMAEKARAENSALAERLEKLEHVAVSSGKSAAKAKPSTGSTDKPTTQTP